MRTTKKKAGDLRKGDRVVFASGAIWEVSDVLPTFSDAFVYVDFTDGARVIYEKDRRLNVERTP